MTEIDLLQSSYYRPLFQLLHDMDRDILALYADRGESRVISSRFVGPLITLSQRGPLPVKELAAAREVTHSAMSQTASAMAKAGLVTIDPGQDARTRVVSPTAQARRIMPLLQAEWRATEATVRALDDELAYPLMQAVREALEALKQVSFADRLQQNLAEQLAKAPE
ncbi:MarR family winged helix-turn-helix transcriptional regulator [Leekyejoonella antrihumi]|uniref:MarR family transcriptional regulator n=1 Tax=Leekyejoonella antrihumi TaxID=1660198 RepID=A0A563DVC5_9MICO|nr:MarR family transcriptional regulator [Leekyejoonella antrihumi]TWP33883.1 MarR family transcriptional regulator [Leekyejoonella antrihumi]